MAVKSFSFKVDFITKNSLCMAHVKQNDNAIFNIYLTHQGQAIDLTGQQVRLFVRKPDGKLVVQEAIEVVDAKGGAIRIRVKNSIFQAVGVAVCEIDLWGNDKNNASSGSFLINIDEQLGSNDAVESYVDVNLFRQLTEYIDGANAEILKYKTLFEAFVKAGVSLQGLNDIKVYIDNNLAELKSETDEAVDLIPKVNKARTDAEAKRVEVVNATNSAEAKRVQVVDTTNRAEAKRIEVVNATTTADNSKNNLVTATTNADNKKKEVEGATASAEAKRKEVVAVTNTANTSKGQLETATANADKKKAEVVSVTADAEKKRVEVVNATNTANASKTALDGSIASGNSVKAGLDASISTGNTLKAGLDASIKSGNATKTALDSATSSANTKKGEVETATRNAESKRVEVVNVTNSAEAKRKELQAVLNGVGSAGFQPKESTFFSVNGKYIAVRTAGRTESQYYEFYDPCGWADIKCRNVYAGDGRYQVYHQGFKPSPADIGALGKTEKASDSAKLNGYGLNSGQGQLTNFIPYVGQDGVLEVGKFIDFHTKESQDFAVRLQAEDGGLNTLGRHKVINDLTYDNTKAPCNTSQIGIQSGNNGLGIGLTSEFNGRNGWIQVGHGDNSHSDVFGTLRLNPKGGDVWINNNLAMSAKSNNEYYGLCVGTDDNTWIRTPQTGLIPYKSGVNSSLGTESWRFANAYISTVNTDVVKASCESIFTDGTGYVDPLSGVGCAIKAKGFIASGKGLIASDSSTGKHIQMGVGGSDCYITNSRSNRYLQLKDDGRLCYNDSQVAYGNNEVILDQGTGVMTEGRVHLGGNIWLFWGWFGINLSDAGAVTRDYTIPACRRIHSVNVSCYSKDAKFTYGELGVLSIWSTGFKTRLYNSRTGGHHYVSYQAIGTI